MKEKFNPESGQEARKFEKQKAWDEMRSQLDSIEDSVGTEMEEEIKDACTALNLLEFKTAGSCFGHTDHGLPAPWIDMKAPNEPSIKFDGEQKIYQAIADKHNVSEKDVKEAVHVEAWKEADQRLSRLDQTDEYQAWQQENVKLREQAQELLNEFYAEREVGTDEKIVIETFEGNIFRMHNGGQDYARGSKNVSDKERLSQRLEKYRQEMLAFTEFLKEKYFNS